ncbi:MAG: S1 RNA-binding domain-containing protein, partial [Phycisphaerales bacterium]|nr:S1 RNA-binding domain-containing protein [Phycisphaerales bacterium]
MTNIEGDNPPEERPDMDAHGITPAPGQEAPANPEEPVEDITLPDAETMDRELESALSGEPAAEASKPSPEDVVTAAPVGDLESEIEDALAGVDLDALAVEEEPRAGGHINLSSGRRTRTGTIAGIRGEDVLVEFGPKSNGVCPLRQFDTPPDTGSSCEFLVERLDAEGMLVLSLPGVVQKADWGTLEVGQTVQGHCIGLNKGGLEVEIDHHKGFMPAGQVDVRHVPDISVLLGEKLICRVTQLDRKRGRLILSR